ncbi:MAG TPA: hypothetical protein VGG06_06115 [Thermoanaerobaculia bacterium]|jgi:hypothetical protein
MANFLLEHLSHGRFNFLDPSEIRAVMPAADDLLPDPERIYLEDETASPLVGFPVMRSRALRGLEGALGEYLQAEEESQFAARVRESFDTRAHGAKWDRYRNLLAQVLRSAIGSSFGARYADIFWLYHSQFAAGYFRGVPKRMLRKDLSVGREFGDEIRYRAFNRWIDRVVEATYDVVHQLASEFGDEEGELFPSLLTLMRDNVLIFTEEHISPDLAELSSYFSGCLKIDGRDLRQRLTAVGDWHARSLKVDPVLRAAVKSLLACALDPPPAHVLNRPGYLRFLSSHVAYSASHFPSQEQIGIWEALLVKLKEFEILQALRRMMVPIEIDEEGYVSRDRSTNTTWVAGPPVLRLSSATRPMDFTSSWVVDPLVQRFGVVYDISDFSATISMLGRIERTAIENAFRSTFNFQRQVNHLADSLHLRLEKYLGDGAFYSGRHARTLIVVAIHLQRLYTRALKEGFPFDRGLRIAINYGEYRLLPLESGPDEKTARYEYFGHGLVELARLTTGKKTQEMDEFKTYLIANGYPEPTVAKFFEPMMRNSADLVNKEEESRPFFAYINANGALVNEGIVATEPFLKRLDKVGELYYGRDGKRGYIVTPIAEDARGKLHVGIRKLGVAKFKGLEQMPVFEIIDGTAWPDLDKLQKVPTSDLLAALDKVFAATYTSRAGKTTTKSRPVVAKK